MDFATGAQFRLCTPERGTPRRGTEVTKGALKKFLAIVAVLVECGIIDRQHFECLDIEHQHRFWRTTKEELMTLLGTP
jgi:hypothetical protein